MSVGTDFVAPRGKRTRSLDSGPSGGAGASRRNKITGIPIFRAFSEMSHYIGTFGGSSRRHLTVHCQKTLKLL